MNSSGSQRDVIANYLFQTFVQGNDCDRPTQIREDVHTYNLARRSLHRPDFKELPLSHQREIVYAGVEALLGILQCTCEGSVLDKLLDKLSPLLNAVLKGESETLRPLLDVLINKGVYPDPDPNQDQHSRRIVIPAGIAFSKSESERAWELEYQGRAHEILLQDIQTSFKKGVTYTNSGAIIQSDGYGKSRTVDQMATLIPTIPMNLRALQEEEQGSFPPADARLIRIFDTIWASDNHLKLFRVFFKLLFELVRDLAKNFGGLDFTTGLYQYFKSRYRRATFYIDLSEKMALNSREVDNEEVIASFLELAKLFPEINGDVKMIIYIDGARTLAKRDLGGTTMYECLLHAVADLASVGVFLLCISSDSRHEIVASEPSLLNSHRFRIARDRLVAPFTAMSFDCHPSLMKKPILSGLMLKETQKFSFIVQFGRPLFWAYFKALARHEDDDSYAQWSVLGMAQTKLFPNVPWGKSDNLGRFSILDTLLNLELEPRKSHSHQLASDLVASHLRTVYSIPADHRHMHTGYSSEPVLAEAALQVLHDEEPATYTYFNVGSLLEMYRRLSEETKDAIVQGERGENAGKMILLLAYMAATKQSYRFSGSATWSYGCSLVSFLRELTSDKFCRDVLTSVPDNITGGNTLEETFKNSWVRFTHFARGADDTIMTSSMAWVAFVRGMAMIACRSQYEVSVSIPILLDKDKPISEANISSILVLFRGGYADTLDLKAGVWEHDIRYFPPPDSSRDAFADPSAPDDARRAYHTRPYISLVMEMGRLRPWDRDIIPHEVVHFLDKPDKPPSDSEEHSSTSVPIPPARNWKPPSSDLVHPRYALFYYGCSHNVYKCIPEEATWVLRDLLQVTPAFPDRSSSTLPIDPLLQMKPFWGARSFTYSWVDEPYFTPASQPPSTYVPEERVLVGTPDGLDLDVDEPC